MNRCGSFPLFSATHSFFSIWTDLKNIWKDPRGTNEEVMRVDLANWALRNSYKFTTGLNISSIRVFDQIRVAEIPITLRPHLCYKAPKSLNIFFLFWYLTIYLRLKLPTNGNIEKQGALLWTGRKSNFCSCSQTDPFAVSTVLPRLLDQKLACNN